MTYGIDITNDLKRLHYALRRWWRCILENWLFSF